MPPTDSLETEPDPLLDAPVFSDLEAAGARRHGVRGFEVGSLAVVAVVARIVLWFLQPGAWWFPDTGDYIDTFGWKPHSNNRGAVLSWLWHIGVAFNYTQRNVIFLQMVLGVLSVLALFDLLRRIVSRRRAFVAALVWAVFPLSLLFERTLMPEAPCADLLIFSLWLATIGFSPPWERWRLIPLTGAMLALSLVALIIPSLELGCGVVAILFVVLAWRRISAGRGSLRRLVTRVSLVSAMVIVFLVPAAAVAIENQRAFGTFSLHPVSGSYLFARWAPLVSCHEDKGMTPLVRGSVHQLCGEPFASLPGENTQDIWDRGTPIIKTLGEGRRFRATQSQLTHLAEHAMLSHPGAVVSQVSKSLFSQLVAPPFNDLWKYNNGRGWYKAIRRASHGADRANWQHWFGSDAPQTESKLPVFQAIAQFTYRWPQYLLWVLALFLLIRGATWVLTRSRRPLPPDPTRVVAGSSDAGPPEGGSWKVQPRLAVVVASSILIFGSALAIAVAAFPVFRYPVTVVPAMLVLLAVAMPQWSTGITRRAHRAIQLGR